MVIAELVTELATEADTAQVPLEACSLRALFLYTHLTVAFHIPTIPLPPLIPLPEPPLQPAHLAAIGSDASLEPFTPRTQIMQLLCLSAIPTLTMR